MPSGRPSPALVISLVALFVALGGTGYAAVKLNGKNLKNRSVSGSKLINNTLTGKQIKESKLGVVPKADQATTATSATTATNATHALSADSAAAATTVGGDRTDHFAVTVAADGGTKTFTAGDVGFAATCFSGVTKLEIHNATSQAGALAAGWESNAGGPTNAHGFNDENFTPDDADDVAGGSNGAGTIAVERADGSVTTVQYGFQDDSQTGGQGCRYFGRAISG